MVKNTNRLDDGQKTVKSMMIYSFGNAISLIVSFATILVVTRILSVSDVGIATSFISLQSILSLICLLSIYISIDRMMIDVKKNEDFSFLSSIYIFSTLFAFFFLMIYLIFKNSLNNLFGFDTPMMLFMFSLIIASNGCKLLVSYWYNKNNYKFVFWYNFFESPVSQLLSIVLIFMFVENKYMGRIIGLNFFIFSFGIFCGIYILFKGKFKFDKDYTISSLKICVPMIPHLLSQILLSSCDLLMIKNIIDAEKAGIYGMAYTISNVLYTVLLQFITPWSPWFYRRMAKNEIDSVKKYSKILMSLSFIMCVGLFSVAPDMIKIFLGSKYFEAITIVTPICIGIFFQIVYKFFYDVEYFYKKNKQIAIFSVITAILNIILNYYGIRKFGYQTAAYTTLICYAFLLVLHYFGSRMCDKRKIFDIRYLIFLSFVLLAVGAVNVLFFEHIILRYIILLLVLLVFVLFYFSELKNLLFSFLGKKEVLLSEKNAIEKSSKLVIILNKFKFLKILKYAFVFVDRILLLFIKKPKKDLYNNRDSILIFTSFGIGDAIQYLSVVDKIRDIYPSNRYEITFMCRGNVIELFKKEARFDNYIVIDALDEAQFSLKKRYNLFKLINSKYYDIVIDTPIYACTMNLYVSMAIRSKEKITIINEADCIVPKFLLNKAYTKIYTVNCKDYSIYKMYNDLFNKIANKDYPYQFHKTSNYEVKIKRPDKYYMIFPSSKLERKKWPVDRYAKIAKRIYKKTKLELLIVGTEEDRMTLDKFEELLNGIPHLIVFNGISLMEYIQIIKDSEFVISNDSGAYHVAVSENIPTCTITGRYALDKFMIYDSKKNSYVVCGKGKCKNCYDNCPYRKNINDIYPCLEEITVDDAWKDINKMIERSVLHDKKKRNKRKNK